MKEIEIKSWTHFVEQIEVFSEDDLTLSEWSFRGQSDASWSLQPHLSRLINNRGFSDPSIALSIEKTIIRYFVGNCNHYPEFKDYKFKPDQSVYLWTIIQHYGGPTRLLDWTDSYLIALYYCVESNYDVDGAIFVINNKSVADSGFDPSSYSERPTIDNLTVMLPWINTKRSYYQQGIFTISNNPVSDHLDLIEAASPQFRFHKLIIPKSLKIEFLGRLRRMNIKADILYPDAFGLGKELCNISKIRLATL